MRGLLLIALMMFAQAVCAGWDGNIFPMWLHTAKTDEVESNVVDQVVKRQISMGIATNSHLLAKTSWWRSRSGNLATIKGKVEDLFEGDRWVVVGSDVLGDLVTNDAVTVYARTNLTQYLAAWQLPTNCLDYTPWRDLSGVGGFTNDQAAVGRPHGVTNSSTAGGGTNFPAGRTCWYTTDYGWDVVPAVVSNLTRLKWDYWQRYSSSSVTSYFGMSSMVGPGCEDAIAVAEAAYTNGSSSSFVGIGQWTSLYTSYADTLHSARLSTHRGALENNLAINSNHAQSAALYLSIIAGTVSMSDPFTNRFDGQSYGWAEGWNVVSPALTNGTFDYVFDVVTAPPNWPDCPGTYESAAAGWSLEVNKYGYVVVTYQY